MKRSLAARLALVYGLTSVVVVAALGLGVYLLTERYLLDQAEDDLAALADFYAAYTAATAPDRRQAGGPGPPDHGLYAPGQLRRSFFRRPKRGAVGVYPRPGATAQQPGADRTRHQRSFTLFLLASQDLPDRLYAARRVIGTRRPRGGRGRGVARRERDPGVSGRPAPDPGRSRGAGSWSLPWSPACCWPGR